MCRGSVLMGTVYVFGIQTANENMSVLTRGNRSLYRKLMYVSRILWDVAVSFTGFFALYICEAAGPTVPFVGVGTILLVYSIFSIVFLSSIRLPLEPQCG